MDTLAFIERTLQPFTNLHKCNYFYRSRVFIVEKVFSFSVFYLNSGTYFTKVTFWVDCKAASLMRTPKGQSDLLRYKMSVTVDIYSSRKIYKFKLI